MTKLLAAIREQERLTRERGESSEDRQAAVDHYLGKPYGDEQDGRSAVVMRDVHDTIEWIKPSLMKVFASGDEVVAFTPRGPEDVEAAEQETEYCNYLLLQKNPGFILLHDWFHDALVERNGYVWVGYEEEDREEREPYQGLTDDEFALLANNPEVEILEHTEVQEPYGDQLVTYHDVVLGRTNKYGCVRVRNIPPERVAVARDWPHQSFQVPGCPFVRITEYRTISECRAQGWDVPDKINDDEESDELEIERGFDDDGSATDDDLEADPATRRVRVRHCWIRYDKDGNGKAELIYAVVIGSVVVDEEPTDLIPVACLTPQRMPHEHEGLSIYDAVADLQRIRTTLIRGFLDNMYLANNGRNAIDKNRVNLEDMMVSRPGGVVRVDGDPTGAIQPLVHVQQGPAIMQAIEYVDTVRENRTGVTKYNQGLDADSLNKTASGVTQIMTAAQQRVDMIARLFAETGVRDLMLLIHAVSLKHTRQAEMVKLRNKWVPVDPRTWKARRDMTVSVGLGTGNKDQMLKHLTMIWQMQMAGMQMGIANPRNLYETAVKITQNAGFKIADDFWSDPAKVPPPQQPNPEQIKAQTAMQLQQMKQADDAQRFQAEQAQEQQRMVMQAEVDKSREEMQARQKTLEAQMKAAAEEAKAAREAEAERMRLLFDKWKVEFEAAVQIALADKTQAAADEKTAAAQQENTDVTAALQQIMAALQDMSQPGEIVRGPDGRAMAVRRGSRQFNLVRDQAGRAQSLQ